MPTPQTVKTSLMAHQSFVDSVRASLKSWPLLYGIRAALATTHRTFLENLRAYPWSFFAYRLLGSFFNIALAALTYNTLFRGKTASSFQAYSGTSDYLTFVAVGISVQAYITGALLNLGRSLITEQRTGTLESLFVTPIPNLAYLSGVMLQQTLLTTIDFLIILFIGASLGANLVHTNWPGLIIVLSISHIGFMGMAVILGGVMLYLRDTYMTQNTVIVILYLICGIFFPIQYLPEWVQRVAYFIPLTHALNLARSSVLLGYSTPQQGAELFLLLVLSLFYCAVGLLLVHRVRRIALEVSLS